MESKVERKCTSCGQWNIGEVENCQFCNAPISPSKIIESRAQERKTEEEQKPADKIDVYLKKLKEHPNIFVRIVFRVVYSTWAIFMFIVSIFVYIVALLPG